MHNQRQKRPASEVMAEVQVTVPRLVPFMFMDGSWIWYCGPSLKGDEASRKALSALGFRFAKRGHLMPDHKTRGWWSHSCDRPTRTHRNRQAPPSQEAQPERTYDPAELLASL